MAKFCTNCGQSLAEGSNNCPNCGAPVNNGNNMNNNGNYNNVNTNSSGTQKSKIAAGLLGIFLGSLGVHNFYLGNIGKAVAQLLISVLSCGALSLVSGIWGLIEGIMILTGSINVDGKGQPLGE